MVEETIGQQEGVGYADTNINAATGTSGVRSAFEGYNPSDGTYVGSTPKKVKKFEMQPINTGNALLDRANTLLNDASSMALMDDNLKQTLEAVSPEYGGHDVGEGYRDTMDDYTMWEYGNNDLDTNLNATNEEEIKLQRNAEQSSLIVLGNGVPRMAVRAVTTALASVTGIIKGVADCFGGNEFVDKYIGPEAMVGYSEEFNKQWEDFAPVYRTKEQEEAESLTLTKWLSASNWADLLDNVGFTVGAVATMVALRGVPAKFMIGAATMQSSGAVMKALTSEDANERTAWQNILPIALAAGVTATTRWMPVGLRNRLCTFATSLISSSGEAEIEAVHARKEFIDSKTEAIKANVNMRKQELIEQYTPRINAAQTQEERDALMDQLQNQLGILDWQSLRGCNQAYKDSESVASITRCLNYAILSGSNMIQFGKMLTGGWKTYNAMGKLSPTKEATRFAQEAFDRELAKAGTDAVKRAEVKAAKEQIMNKALLAFKAQGGKPFDEATKLSLGRKIMIGAKMPLVEGNEEISQAVAANIGKGYAERNTDDYYGQITGLDQFRRAETGFLAEAKNVLGDIGKTYTSRSAWDEFLAGAIMGAIGCPWARSARFTRSTGEKDANGNVITEKHWRSPIFLQGGIKDEIKRATFEKQRMGEMAQKLNQHMSEKNVKDFQRRLAVMAHHAQYEDDKDKAGRTRSAFFNNITGDKFTWQNAEDADLLKEVELYQNTGQLGLLKSIVSTNLDFQSAADLRVLQSITNEKDENGNVIGPYSKYDLTEVAEDASDENKQRLAKNVSDMKAKIKEQTERYLHAIDTYEAARRELNEESQQGLTDDQLNCLTWYRVRLAQFDKRTKEMFEKHKGDLEGLNSKIGDFFTEQKNEADLNIGLLNAAIAKETDEAKKKSMEAQKELLNKSKSLLDMAQDEWDDRWERMQQETDPMKQARILFAGNASADPIGMSRAKKPWYMPNKQWAKRVRESMLPAAQRRQALMGQRLDFIGLDSQATAGVLDTIIDDLSSPTSTSGISAALKDKFSDDAHRKEFAIALNDMRQCQAAIVRYKDLYQFYKDNPYAMTLRQAQEKAKIEEEAKQEEVKQQETDLAKAKTVAEMYDIIRKKIVKGEDIPSINQALDNLVKAGNKIAQQLLKNQEYVRAFAAAAESIRIDDKNAHETGRKVAPGQLYIPLLKQVMIDASRECTSVEKMHEYVLNKIKEITQSAETYADYLKKIELINDDQYDDIIESLKSNSSAEVKWDESAKKYTTDKSHMEKKINRARKALPEMVNTIDNIIKKSAFNKSKYAFGESVSDEEAGLSREYAIRHLSEKHSKETEEVIDKMTQFGDFQLSSDNTTAQPQSQPQQPSQQPTQQSQQPAKQQKPAQQPKSQEEEDIQILLNRVHPYGGREEDAAEDEEIEDETPAEDEARKNAQDEAQSQQDKSVWRPIMSYFNLARRRNGETIRNDRVKDAGGNNITDNPSESWCGKFFSTLETLNVFKVVDEVGRDESGAIKAGEDVYFIIDKMGQNGKSEIFGLAADEIAYNGTPHIFMAVKRGNGYQCFGTMSTAANKLSQYGQTSFVDMMRKNAETSSGAYVHGQTAKVKGLHSGLVEIQGRENTLDKIYGGLANVRIVAQGQSIYAFQQADRGVGMNKAERGSIYAVVTDNATGVDRLMPCRLAHFNSQEQGKYTSSTTWSDVEENLAKLVAACQNSDIEQAKTSVNEFYNKLNSLLSLTGYGIHIDLVERKNGNVIVVSRVAWENGGPKPLMRDGEVQYRKDKNGDFIKNGNDDKIPLHERTVAYVDVNDAAALSNLREELMKFNPPFRVKLSDIANQNIGTLIKEGIITSNIVDGGGICTRGGFVEVDASMMQVTNNNNQRQSQAQQQPQQAKQTNQNGQVEEYELAGHKFTINRSNGELMWRKWNGVDYINTKVTGREAEVIDKMLNGSMEYEIAEDAMRRDTKVVFYPNEQDSKLSKMLTIGQDIKADRTSPYFTDYHYQLGAAAYNAVSGFEEFLKDCMQMDIHAFRDGIQAARDKGGEEFLSYVDTLLDNIKDYNASSKFPQLYGAYITDDEIMYALSEEMAEAYELAKVELGQRELAMQQKAEEEAEAQGEASEQEEINESVDEEDEEFDVSRDESEENEQENDEVEQKNEISEEEDFAVNRSNLNRGGEKYTETATEDSSDFNFSNEAFSVISKQDQFKHKADYTKEIAALRNVVPYLTRDEAVMIIDGLIETGRKGVLAQGQFRNGLIILSREGVQGTAFHEAFHGVFRTALNDEQRAAMLKDAKRLAKTELNSEAEEWLADAFRDYMIDQVYPKSWTQRIKDFFRSLFRLVSMPHYHRSPICRKIFADINKGSYREAGSQFTVTTLKEERMKEYRDMGLDSAAIELIEDSKSSFAARSVEERSMLAEAGISEDAFNLLDSERRDEIIRCL